MQNSTPRDSLVRHPPPWQACKFAYVQAGAFYWCNIYMRNRAVLSQSTQEVTLVFRLVSEQIIGLFTSSLELL